MARLDAHAETASVAPWGERERTALVVILALCAVYATWVLLGGAISVLSDLVSGGRFFSVGMNEPLPASADTASATIVGGGLDSATVFATGLSFEAATLLTAGGSVTAIAHLLVALVFVYLVWRLLRREPFLRSLTRSFVWVGGILMVGSLLGQALIGIGSNLAAKEVGLELGYNRFWPLPVELDAAPLALGFMLVLVGLAFEYAQKLTNETRGLV